MEAAGTVAVPKQASERRPGQFLPGTSGNPLGKASIRERAIALFNAMAGDFGGAEMSAVDTVLLRQACMLIARSERVHRAKDIDASIRQSGEARRLLATLRRHASAPPTKPLSLDEHLARAEAARTTDHGNGFTGHPDGEVGA
jgi:hypothetical protein